MAVGLQTQEYTKAVSGTMVDGTLVALGHYSDSRKCERVVELFGYNGKCGFRYFEMPEDDKVYFKDPGITA